jgi:putative addiction module killer protein
MAILKQTEEFVAWLKGLKDANGKGRIVARVQRLQTGNAGDTAPVGNGISEMRIHFGPGYRVYYKQHGETATLLCGGDKDTQQSDIAKAKDIASKLED